MEIKTKFDIGDRVIASPSLIKGSKPIIFKITSINVDVIGRGEMRIDYGVTAVTPDALGTRASEDQLVLATEAAVKQELEAYMKQVKESLMENCYLADGINESK